MTEGRFAGKLDKEYDLFEKACPHSGVIQDEVSSALYELLANTSLRNGLLKGEYQVLEIGCGNGRTTSTLLSKNTYLRLFFSRMGSGRMGFIPNITVTAIDNEPTMIEQAQKNLEQLAKEGMITEGHQGTRYKIVQADALEFLEKSRSESYDAVVSAFTFHNFEGGYRSQVLSELYRVLKQPGIVVNGDKFACDDPAEHQERYAAELACFDYFDRIGRPDLKEEWLRHMEADENPNVIMKEGAHIRELYNIGFGQVFKSERQHLEMIVAAIK